MNTYVPEEKVMDNTNWSRGAWEKTCRTRLIRQRQATDCGVACLAMLARVSYETAYATMAALGYDQGPRPMATNYQKIERAMAEHGLLTQRRRWSGWNDVHSMGLLKVPSDARMIRRHWHWVVAERHPTFGMVLRDPAYPLVAIEKPPLHVMHQDLHRYEPYGMWVSVMGSTSSD